MKRHFIVAPIDNHWIVSSPDGQRVAYEERSQAIRAAVEAAHAAGGEGFQAQVFAIGESNTLYPLWTYGIDAFLPDPDAARHKSIPRKCINRGGRSCHSRGATDSRSSAR